jgi:hypothetical protein
MDGYSLSLTSAVNIISFPSLVLGIPAIGKFSLWPPLALRLALGHHLPSFATHQNPFA